MFTRISRSRGRAYLQLVESYRNEEGQPRQRVIANFGRLDKLSSKDLDPLIDGLQRALGRFTSTPRVAFDTASPTSALQIAKRPFRQGGRHYKSISYGWISSFSQEIM